MDNIKISVIIPTLDESKLIKNLLMQFDESVKNKYDVEVILSDGKSSDTTVNIARGFADKIIVHDKKFKQNIAEGRNKGAEISQGDVLVFLNADVRIASIDKFFHYVNENINKNGYSAIAFPIRVFQEEEILSDKLFHKFYNFYVSVLNRIGLGMGRGECHVTKKSNFLKAGRYNESFGAGEDFDLYKRLRKFGKILYTKEIVIQESPRRYRKFGYRHVVWDWLLNAISVMFFKKSVSKIWEPVR